LDGQTARGRLTVFLGGIILAEVNLSIPVDSSHRTGSKTNPHEVERARPYRRIFASYSRKDGWVVEQFTKYAGALGDEYVKKHIPLRAGEEWSGKLQRLIEEADIFQLFWSTNSMRSPFVRREWEHALSLRRPNFIRPCYWENPLPTCPEKNLPPEELRRLRFQRISVALPKPGPRDAALKIISRHDTLARAEEPVDMFATMRPAWLLDEVRAILSKAREENRSLTEEEQREVRQLMGEDEALTSRMLGAPAPQAAEERERYPTSFGDYAVDHPVAGGALGRVYLGRSKLQRPVA